MLSYTGKRGVSKRAAEPNYWQKKKMVEIWADYPFYYHVMSAELKGRDRRQLAMEDISKSG